MGMAIPLMHYTGMAAVSYMPMNAIPDLSHAIDISVLANTAVIVVTLVILGSALVSSLVVRRFSAQAKELEFSEQRYQHLFESNPQPTLVFDLPTLYFLTANRAAQLTYGFSDEEFLRLQFTDLYPEAVLESLMRSTAAEDRTEEPYRRTDGTAFYMELSLRPITWVGRPAALLLANDITERKRSEQMEAERRTFLESVSQNQDLEDSLRRLVRIVEDQVPGALCSVLLMKPGKSCHVAASSFAKDTSLILEEFRLEDIVDDGGAAPDFGKMVFLEHFSASCSNPDLEEWALAFNLASCWIAPVLKSGVQLSGLLVIFFREIRKPTRHDRERLHVATRMAAIAIEHQRLTDRLAYQAQHDALTGLPNRFLLEDRLRQALAYADRHASCLAVLLLDLDGFKYINDSLGHQAGDQVLVEITQRLRAVIRQTDTLARLGGDEFCIIATDLHRQEDAFRVAQSCLDSLRRPIRVAERDYPVSASIGISYYPEHGDRPEILQQHADTAMYHAKFNGKNGFQVFTPEINAQLRERLQLMADLREALERGQFRLEYQPLFLANGELSGFEALLRWDHPVRGTVSPGKFIPIAEETGLVVPIGKWVLLEACRQLTSWRGAGYNKLRMSINVSTLQLERHDWIETILDTLRDTGLPASAVEIELTETVVMKNFKHAAERLAQLRQLGISSAIDDFGTGYSSLTYLQDLPIDALKIDQSFVRNLNPLANGETANGAIVKAIVTLAQELGLRVIAEGVETAEELDVLRCLGCDLLQGYFLSRPMDVEACDLFLRKSYSSEPLAPSSAP
jgi:diguanylate cyclase (GGDEF)-like protein/PAS domain S-box-containing protein